MTDAFVCLLGPPTATGDGTWHVLPLTRPVCFYSYLALRRAWVARDELAYVFRPDAPAAAAKHYVRNLILRTRALPTGFLLETRRDHCRLLIDTDVARFYGALEDARWEEAIDLYKGTLLEGFNAGDVPVFASWLEQRRVELDSAWHRASMEYAENLEASHRHAEASNILGRLLHGDPFNEQALQAFVRNAALAGQRKRALEAGDRFLQELQCEFGVDPEEATLTLLGQVRRCETVDDVEAIARRERHRRWSDQSGAPPDETEEITSLLKHPEHRLLTLLGPERMGEPMLLVARRARNVDSATWAIIDLAETLMARRHFRRATELLALIASRRSLDPRLGRRFDAVVGELERHVPRRFIDSLLEA